MTQENGRGHGRGSAQGRQGSLELARQRGPGIVSVLARDIADTLAAAELSEWLTQHDADPMRMSPAGFGAFVVSEAGRAAVLLSTS